MRIPRLTLAALRGGAGKTLVSVGITAALRNKGKKVAVFKKGPDYIDAGWLGLAASADCYNLDTYLCPETKVRSSFAFRSVDKDIAIIEGNRGLFDGVDAEGSFSTAELAKLMQSPVLLIVDAVKVTRTAAAMVLGCKLMDPKLNIRGVILNRVAGARHERILRDAIETTTGIPVIGSLSKLAISEFPQRHLGLLPLHEHPKADKFISDAAELAEQNLDMDRILEIAGSAGAFSMDEIGELFPCGNASVRIGVLRDSAFQFYYPENLEALERRGAELVQYSSLYDKAIEDVDALYIGGGFPETHAEQLAANTQFKESVLAAAKRGLPIYAECGGLMYLSRNLLIDENRYPMVGLFPIDTILERRPQGHGYIQVETIRSNPFYPVGKIITGHEFHYSHVTGLDDSSLDFAFSIKRGHGMDGSREGLFVLNALGTYAHVHALGEPEWSAGLVNSAEKYKAEKESNSLKT